MHAIYQVIKGRTLYWNTCGWTELVRNARLYSPAESKYVFNRMTRDGVRCVLTSVGR